MCHAQFDLYIYFLLFSFFLNNEKQSVNFYYTLGSTTIFYIAMFAQYYFLIIIFQQSIFVLTNIFLYIGWNNYILLLYKYELYGSQYSNPFFMKYMCFLYLLMNFFSVLFFESHFGSHLQMDAFEFSRMITIFCRIIVNLHLHYVTITIHQHYFHEFLFFSI